MLSISGASVFAIHLVHEVESLFTILICDVLTESEDLQIFVALLRLISL